MGAYRLELRGLVNQPLTNKQFRPLNLGRLFFDKKRKMYGVALETKVEKGVVKRLSEIADNIGVIIRFIQVSMEKADSPTARAIAFLDFSNSNASPEEALRYVEKLDFVKEAQIIYPTANGTLSDEYFFPLIVGQERAVIFDKPAYESLFKGLIEKFGSAGEAILYYQGFNVGYNTISDFEKIAGSRKLEVLMELIKVYTRVLGWGIVEDIKVNLKTKRAKIRLSHCFECEIGKGSGKPYSHFIRGIAAGIFTRIFDKTTSAREVKCSAKGDAYCEFHVKTS